MRGFITVWLGQIVSQFGSAMTGFGVSIWLYGQTGEAATLTWAMVAFFAPLVFLSPIAGTIVDRGDRKQIMIVTDLVAGLTTIIMFALFATGGLAIWHIYLLNFVNGAFNSLQWPAFSSAVTMMLSKKHYARASGMMSIAESGSQILAPAAAASLLAFGSLQTILIFDIVTFLFAVGALLLVHVPSPPRSAEGEANRGNLWRETLVGFTYIWRRKPLLALQMVFFFINFASSFVWGLIIPMLLASTGNNELIAGTVQSVGAIGGVAGGVALSIWGGPKRKVFGVLGGMLGVSLLGEMLLGIANSLPLWMAAAFISSFFIPILNGSNQAIWQAKVAPDVQGRVFSVRRLIAQVTGPFAIAMSGPLADRVFEPALAADGRLAPVFGWLVGVGPGAGMSLMLVFAGLAGALVAVVGLMTPIVRNVEQLLPDHEAVAETQAAAALDPLSEPPPAVV